MQRDVLLLGEMIDPAEQIQVLVKGATVKQLVDDRQRRDALLWNYTVLGEAAAQLSSELKSEFPDLPWEQPSRLRNRIVHGYWSIDLEILHTTATDQLPTFIEGVAASSGWCHRLGAEARVSIVGELSLGRRCRPQGVPARVRGRRGRSGRRRGGR